MNQSSVSLTRGTTEKAKRTKEAILRAAERVFGDKGFERASIAMITQEAGVAQGTFYLYFVDKKAVFVALVEELGHALRAALREATVGLMHRIDVEHEGFRAFFRFVAGHRDLYRIVRQAEFVDEAAYHAYYERLAEGYARGLRRAMHAGQIRRADPDRLAYCLMGIADFLGLRGVLWEKEPDVDALTAAAMDLVREGVVPRAKEKARASQETRAPARRPPRSKKQPRTKVRKGV
jgi:AcrR family transcriptional regulator